MYIFLIGISMIFFYLFYRSLNDSQKKKFLGILNHESNEFDNNNKASNLHTVYNNNTNLYPHISSKQIDTMEPESSTDYKSNKTRHNIEFTVDDLHNIIKDTNNESPTLLQTCPFCASTINIDETTCHNCGLSIPNEAPKKQIKRKIFTENGSELYIKSISTDRDFIRPYPPTENKICEHCSLYKYTVIDFETANMYPDSVCQIGIVVVENQNIIEKHSFLIRPPYNDFRNSHIHGITLKDVEHEKTFSELWPMISPYIDNCLVGAYNADFDIGCLTKTLKTYGISFPDFAYFDILKNARENFSEYKRSGDLDNFRLSTVANFFNIKFATNAHDALSDAIAAAQIQFECDMTETFSFMFSKNNNHYEVMPHLLQGKAILTLIRRNIVNSDSNNISDYQNEISLVNNAIQNGADKGKCLRCYGEILEKCHLYKEALEKYQEAYVVNDKVGVKSKIRKLSKLLNNSN